MAFRGEQYNPTSVGESLIGRYGRFFTPTEEKQRPTYETIHQYDYLESPLDLMAKRRRGFAGWKAPPAMVKKYRRAKAAEGRGYYRRAGFYGRYGGGFQNRSIAKREAKFFDTVIANNAVNTSGEIYSLSLNLIPGGSTESTRIGRLIVVKQLNMRFLVKSPAQGTISGDAWVRLIIYCDKQTNGATAAVTDLLDSADFISYSNLANATRFRILWSKWVHLDVNAAAGDGTTNDSAAVLKLVSCSIPMNLQIDFEGVTGAITELCCNNIGVLAISTLATTEVAAEARLRYYD